MATNSSNIKAYYGRMVEGINVFPSVKLTSESIKEFLADYSNLHMTLHMFRSSLADDHETQMNRIHKFLDKYNLTFNPEIELLTNKNEQLEYYQDGSKAPIAFLSVPVFNVDEQNTLYLESGVLIIGERLIPEGFKFTFDKNMEEELSNLPTAKVGNIQYKEIDDDMYTLSAKIIEEGKIQELVDLYNQLGYDEIASYLEEKNKKCPEGEEEYVFDDDYPYIRSCTFELGEDDKYDYYFSKSIDFKTYRGEPYAEDDLYDCYFIKWINTAEKCAFLNIEVGIYGDYEFSEFNDEGIFDCTINKVKTYNEFLDMMIMINDITVK